jgi:hypothetical protein
MREADDKIRIFPVETRFQQLARRPGGIPRDKALEQAQSKIDEAKPTFDDWLNQQLEALVAVVERAQTANADLEWVETANRYCRQLRDVGTTMDFELLTFIAGSLSEMLDAIAVGSECNMDSIRCHIDALLLARQKSYRGVKPEQVPELIRGLRRVVEQVSTLPP